eukprot:5755294-Pyramimonas_sp.AAC.1
MDCVSDVAAYRALEYFNLQHRQPAIRKLHSDGEQHLRTQIISELARPAWKTEQTAQEVPMAADEQQIRAELLNPNFRCLLDKAYVDWVDQKLDSQSKRDILGQNEAAPPAYAARYGCTATVVPLHD